MKIKDTSFDKTGIFISGLCIFHCTLVPVLVGFLPALGLQWLVHNPIIHFGLFILMILFANIAFILRYKKHGSLKPAPWLLAGILLVGLGNFIFTDHSMHKSDSNHSHHSQHGHMKMNEAQTTKLPFDLTASTLFAVIGGVLLIRGHYLNQKKACCLT